MKQTQVFLPEQRLSAAEFNLISRFIWAERSRQLHDALRIPEIVARLTERLEKDAADLSAARAADEHTQIIRRQRPIESQIGELTEEAFEEQRKLLTQANLVCAESTALSLATVSDRQREIARRPRRRLPSGDHIRTIVRSLAMDALWKGCSQRKIWQVLFDDLRTRGLDPVDLAKSTPGGGKDAYEYGPPGDRRTIAWGTFGNHLRNARKDATITG